MKGTKMQNGITLIALIITIFVLLILAGISIAIIQESDIIGKAKEAVEKHEAGKADEESKLQGYEDFLDSYMSGEGGENIPVDEISDELKKYILGADLAGRPMTDIIDMDTFGFIDDTTTEGIDETQTIGAKFITAASESDELVIIYFESQGVTYKFGFNLSSVVTDASYGVVKVYEPEEGTRVGKTVKYDDKIWTILYDDSTNGLQMISNQSLLYNDDSFYLGYNDSIITDWTKLDIETEEFKTADVDTDKTLTNFERGIYSYNKAIDTLNTACKSLVTPNSSIIDVRCVGSNPTNKNAENEILYTSEELEIWPIDNATYAAGIGNGRGKSTDLNYVSDFERMIALGINIGYDSTGSGSSYWLASRLINLDSERQRMFFKIREVSSEGSIGSDYLWYVIKMDVGGGNSSHTINSALRPVVIFKPDVELIADTTGEADYTF